MKKLRIKKMLVPTDIPQLLQPGRIILLPGKILVKPHGTLIWQRKKKAIVSSRLFKKYIGIPVYLIEEDKALGIIEIKKGKEIDLKEFEKLRKFHKIANSERKKWWPKRKTLFYYPIELISKFEPPKEILRPKGAQVWLESVTFKSINFGDPAKFSDEELLEIHEKLHGLWQQVGAPEEEIMNYHILVRDEISKRKLKHKDIDSLDKKSREFEERFAKEGFKLTFYGTKGLVEEEGPGHRFHTSVLYEYRGKRLLVDYGKINQKNLSKIRADYILNSHAHPDHFLGLEDMSIIVSKETEKAIPGLHKDFNIDTRAKYESYKTFEIGPFKITPIPVLHSLRAPMHVFLIRLGNKRVLQATDILGWHSGDREKYVRDLDLAIIDGSSFTRTLVRRKGKEGEPYGHSSIQNQLKNWYTINKVKRIIITHLGKEPLSFGDEELLKKIKEITKVPIIIAQDNNIINLSEGYAPIYTSGKRMGRPLKLKEVLPYFKNFAIQKPLIYLTGGIVNRTITKGDLDILLPDWLSLDMRRIIEFRIVRSVPWWIRRRLHFVYDKFSTPFTNAVPLYDLEIKRSKERILRLADFEKELREKPRVAGAVKDAEASAREDKIKLFRYFLPLKPTRGYYPEKRQTIDLFIEVMEKAGDYPFYSTKKYDGFHAEIHKKGNKIKIFSEDGEDNTARIPTVVEEIRKLSKEDFVIMAELEIWQEGKHKPREVAAGYMHRKGIPDDSNVVLNVYDLLYYKEDIHNKPFEERLKILEKLPFRQKTFRTPDVKIKLNFAPYLISKNRAELKKHTEFLRKLPWSEGNVAKTKDFKSNLKGIRSGMVKYHNSTAVYGKVLEIKETAVKNVFNYYFGLEPGRYKMKTEKLGNIFYHRSGRTFSTSIKANVGDVLEIEGETLNAEHDLRTDEWKISIWAPRCMGKVEKKADTVQEAISRAKKNYCLQIKKITKEGKTIYLSEFEKQQDPYLEYPAEEKKWKYVIQRHFRGAGHHLDWRFNHNNFLIGWTIADQIKGKPGKPILTLGEARKLNQSEISKIDWKKGVPKLRPGIKPGYKKKYAELAAIRKSREPKAWLNVQGVTPKGEVGACFKEGTLVLTQNGFKPIETIKSGNLVFTHKGQWKEVLETIITKNEKRQCYLIKNRGGQNVVATENHPFFIAELWYTGKGITNKIKNLSWKTAEELYFLRKKSRHSGEKFKFAIPLPKCGKLGSYDLGLISGFCLGDGYIRHDNRIEFYFNRNKEGRLARFYQHILKNLNLESSLARIHNSCIIISFISKEIKELEENLLKNPHSINNFSREFAKGLVDGLLDSDGYENKITQKTDLNGLLPIAILQSGSLPSFWKDERVTSYGTSGVFNFGVARNFQISSDEKYILKYFEIEKIFTPTTTYNLTVKNDNSYFIQNAIAHNTAEFPGVFHIIDKGFVERGASKSYFHEYFLSGGKLKGRWFFRQLRPKEFRGEIEKQEVIPPARETKFREEAPWFMIKPLVKTPYVISKAAVDKNWIPPQGVSALPEHIRKRIPEKFQYWKLKEEKRRLEVRNDLVKAKIIKLSEMVMKPYISEHSCRLFSPKEYDRFFRQNCKIKHNGKCIHLIFGVKKGKSEVQSLRYPKNVWPASEARIHCKAKNGTFEAAKIEKALNPGAKWAKACYHYVLSQQQMTIWLGLSLQEKVEKVRTALKEFEKLKSLENQSIKDIIEWLQRKPNEMKEIIIDLILEKKTITKSRDIPFVLQHHFFRGPKIIRAGVSSEHWDLRFNFPERKGLVHFVLDLNPLKNIETTAFIKPCEYKEWMNISQYLPPKNERAKMSKEELKKLPPGIEEANPTLDTSAFIKIIDKGKATVLEDGETFKKFQFKGKELKGLWILERENMSNFWVFKKSKLPSPK